MLKSFYSALCNIIEHIDGGKQLPQSINTIEKFALLLNEPENLSKNDFKIILNVLNENKNTFSFKFYEYVEKETETRKFKKLELLNSVGDDKSKYVLCFTVSIDDNGVFKYKAISNFKINFNSKNKNFIFYKFIDNYTFLYYITYIYNDIKKSYDVEKCKTEDLNAFNNMMFKGFQKISVEHQEDFKKNIDIYKDNMVKYVNDYIKKYHDLLKLTEFKQHGDKYFYGFDLSKGGPLKNCIRLHRFLNKHIRSFEKIGDEENELLAKLKNYGLMYKDKKYKGFITEIDYNKYYLYLLQSKDFKIPLTQGEKVKELQESEKVFNKDSIVKFGLYNVVITCPDDNDKKKLFLFNSNNIYTHYDIRTAIFLGFNITYDTTKDFYYYKYDITTPCNFVTGLEFSRTFYNYIYEWSYKHKEYKDDILFLGRTLAGAYCERKVKYIYGSPEILNNEKYAKYDVVDFQTIDHINDLWKFGIIKNNVKGYKYGEARALLFLTSYGRSIMAKFGEQFNNDIIKINTDSIAINRELTEDEIIYFQEYDDKHLIVKENGRELIDKTKNSSNVIKKYKNNLTISYAMGKVDTKYKVLVQKDTWGASKIKIFKNGYISATGKLKESE